jgi:CarD family transcriptional regulator
MPALRKTSAKNSSSNSTKAKSSTIRKKIKSKTSAQGAEVLKKTVGVVRKSTIARAAVTPQTFLTADNKASAGAVSVARTEDFKLGDKVVYPGHGVGEIAGVRSQSIGGSEQKIFDILMLESGMKIMVPVAQANAVGLRKVVDKKAIDKVYSILKHKAVRLDTQTWNRRFREYTQKIKTGSVYEIAEVLRDLSVLSVEKELSFGEKKMLDTAQTLLVSEIAIAKARPQERVMGELREIFS